MIESLQAENADLKKNLSLAGSRQNELKVQLASYAVLYVITERFCSRVNW